MMVFVGELSPQCHLCGGRAFQVLLSFFPAGTGKAKGLVQIIASVAAAEGNDKNINIRMRRPSSDADRTCSGLKISH